MSEGKLRLAAILLAASVVWACDKKKEVEDTDQEPDSIDLVTDIPENDTSPDVPEDLPVDAPVDAPEDTGVDEVEDVPEEEIVVASGIAFSVAPLAEGLPSTGVEAQADPQSAIYVSDTGIDAHTAGTNALWADAAALGIASADDIDGISVLKNLPPYRPTWWHSVKDLPGHDEGESWTDVRQESDAAEVPGDVFESAGTETSSLEYDEVSLGLMPQTLGGTPKDDLDALDLTPPAVASGIVFFTVAPGAAGTGSTAVATTPDEDLAGTVFLSALDGDNEVAFTRTELGLAPDDDVDALVVFGSAGVGRYVHFSVTAGSQGMAGTAVATERAGNGAAGDVFASAGEGYNTLHMDAADFGLRTGSVDQDEMDALDEDGDWADFDVPITPITPTTGLHSFYPQHGFFRDGLSITLYGAIAHYGTGNVYVVDGDFTLMGTWTTFGPKTLDVAIADNGSSMLRCTDNGVQLTMFPTPGMTVGIFGTTTCLQAITASGMYWFIDNAGTTSSLMSHDFDAPGTDGPSATFSGAGQGLAARHDTVYAVVDPGSGNGSLMVFDISGGTVVLVGTPWTVGQGPRFVALDDAGTMAIVTNSLDDTASIIDLATGVVDHTVDVGDQPFGVAAVANVALVANFTGDTLSVVDMASGTVVHTIDVTGCSPGFVRRVDGTTLVSVSCFDGNEIELINLAAYLRM